MSILQIYYKYCKSKVFKIYVLQKKCTDDKIPCAAIINLKKTDEISLLFYPEFSNSVKVKKSEICEVVRNKLGITEKFDK